MDEQAILRILDGCCERSTFPVLDNGYVYLAATRLSLYRSKVDWGLVIEVFGFSPRSGLPDTAIYTFGSHLRRVRSASDFVSEAAWTHYVRAHHHDELHFVHPIDEGDWQDADQTEWVAQGATACVVRGNPVTLPPADAYARWGIALSETPRIQVFEACRALAELRRDAVLATPEERCAALPDALELLMQLEAWRHPDLAGGERCSASATFRSLASVLAGGDVTRYRPEEPNTHWRFWPEGGTL